MTNSPVIADIIETAQMFAVTRDGLKDVQDAIREGNYAEASAIIEKINDEMGEKARAVGYKWDDTKMFGMILSLNSLSKMQGRQ